MTGGRIKRIKDYIDDETFMLTYGDGVCNVDVRKLVDFHKKNGKIATLTAVNVGQRFGVLGVNQENVITSFREKKEKDGAVINGGFMVLEPKIFDFIEGDDTVFEQYPLEKVAEEGQLMAFHHDGFGNVWIHSGTRCSLRKCGLKERRRGNYGNRFRVL